MQLTENITQYKISYYTEIKILPISFDTFVLIKL